MIPTFPINFCKIQLVACLDRQLGEEGLQSPPITFTEWVKGVNFTKIMGKTIQKCLASHTLEIVFSLQSSKNLRSIGDKMFRLSKEVCPFGKRTVPQLSSPLVDILKNMSMD